ncbi:MAG: hypothetical protein MZW92_52050 [Comamonadaceae bacterium]|nr:hypothetical protein [Comamonadaceae bacterium]
MEDEFSVERFYIAKYPVTYWQYWAFLDAPKLGSDTPLVGGAEARRES